MSESLESRLEEINSEVESYKARQKRDLYIRRAFIVAKTAVGFGLLWTLFYYFKFKVTEHANTPWILPIAAFVGISIGAGVGKSTNFISDRIQKFINNKLNKD